MKTSDEVRYPLAGNLLIARYMKSPYASLGLLEDVYGIKPKDAPARFLIYATGLAGSHDYVLEACTIERIERRGPSWEDTGVYRFFDPDVRARFELNEFYMFVHPGSQGDMTPLLGYAEGYDTVEEARAALDEFLPPYAFVPNREGAVPA